MSERKVSYTAEIVNMHSEIMGIHYFSIVYIKIFKIVKFRYLKIVNIYC